MPPDKPSDFEMQILATLWKHGPLTAREMLSRLPDGKKRAYTSVLSVMQVMERKELLGRTREGLTDRWHPTVEEAQILGPFMKNLVSRIFGGSARNALQCLFKEGEVDPGELDEIRKLLDTYQTPDSDKRKEQ
jgi:BlaI family penicillinase repressor